MAHALFGIRIKALREERKLSQDDLAKLFGFKDRQTISAIETGERRLSAEELMKAVEVLGAPLDYFTDPFRLVGNEGRFNWRQSGVQAAVLAGYERNAGRWIATFRELAPKAGHKMPLLRHSLSLTTTSRLEDAMAAGDDFAAAFELGDVPARRLADAMERRFGILVLMVDSIKGISGAACRLPELDAVLINRHEPRGRRHFDLAHELFHILTWEAMPPAHVEDANEITGKTRVEQLANAFASAVLMPKGVIDRFGAWDGLDADAMTGRLNEVADALDVTAVALKWRLVALGLVNRTTARGIPDAALRNNGRNGAEPEAPPPFSRLFAEVIACAVEDGHLSARRAAGVLGVTLDDLVAVCAAHGVDTDMDL